MGGIAGVISASEQRPLAEMRDRLEHRGGLAASELLVGSARLASCFATEREQPTDDRGDSGWAAVVDGFLPRTSESRNYSGAIARAFASGGVQGLSGLEGSFALALCDGATLVLVRDHNGSRPLYYATAGDGRSLWFASEIKALLPCPGVVGTIDRSRICDLVIHGHPMGNGTLFSGIQSVQPGEVVSVRLVEGLVSVTLSEMAPKKQVEDMAQSEEDVLDGVKTYLTQAVRLYVGEGQWPVSIALSGGLDSSVIALAAVREAGPSIVTVSLRTDRTGEDHDIAQQVAAAAGSQHCEVVVDWESYLRAIPSCIFARELPTVSGLSIYMLAQEAKRHGRICLNGVGAAELFLEQNNYIDWSALRARVSARMMFAEGTGLPISDAAVTAAQACIDAESYASYLVNWDARAREWYLRPVEAGAMAHSVEMRSPYYEDALMQFAGRIPEKWKIDQSRGIDKYLLKRVALRLFGDAAALPVLRRKQALPEATMGYANQFAELCESLLPDRYVQQHPLGTVLQGKHKLMLWDVFEWTFVSRRAEQDPAFDMMEFIQQRAQSA